MYKLYYFEAVHKGSTLKDGEYQKLEHAERAMEKFINSSKFGGSLRLRTGSRTFNDEGQIIGTEVINTIII